MLWQIQKMLNFQDESNEFPELFILVCTKKINTHIWEREHIWNYFAKEVRWATAHSNHWLHSCSCQNVFSVSWPVSCLWDEYTTLGPVSQKWFASPNYAHMLQVPCFPSDCNLQIGDTFPSPKILSRAHEFWWKASKWTHYLMLPVITCNAGNSLIVSLCHRIQSTNCVCKNRCVRVVGASGQLCSLSSLCADADVAAGVGSSRWEKMLQWWTSAKTSAYTQKLTCACANPVLFVILYNLYV